MRQRQVDLLRPDVMIGICAIRLRFVLGRAQTGAWFSVQHQPALAASVHPDHRSPIADALLGLRAACVDRVLPGHLCILLPTRVMR